MMSRHRMASDISTDSPFHAKQIVFLFMAATVVAVVVFLCGVLVGRGVPLGGSRRAAPAGLADRAITDLPPPTLSTPSSEPSAAARTSDDLTYPGRLSNGTRRQDSTGDLDDEPLAPPEVVESDTGARADADADTDTDVAPEPVPAVPEFESPVVPEGAYVVQVMALQAPVTARNVAEGLVDKGFSAFVLEPFPDDPVSYYRVRVGPFTGRADAVRVRDRLTAEEGLRPYIVQ